MIGNFKNRLPNVFYNTTGESGKNRSLKDFCFFEALHYHFEAQFL